jgi:Leucine-rich repeat (LRR) protein
MKNSLPLTPKEFFKLNSNNFLWNLLLNIIDENFLNVQFIKVKAHSNNILNNEVDSSANAAHNSTTYFNVDNFVHAQLQYLPCWHGIPIENHLRHFITNISRNIGFESFLNLSRNQKYRTLHINWSLTFQHLDDDADHQSTSFTFSRKKAHRIKLLTEELPTIEQLKKRRYDLY